MPKRKRSTYEWDGNRVLDMQKKDIAEKLIRSKKLLHRALKTAKGFERQKLGKKFKIATEQGKTEELKRINGEIYALKGLDLDKTTDAHLHRSLLKLKAVAESELLPEDVKKEIEKPEMGEEERKALHNVTSCMVNTKPVKDIMGQIINGMYIVLGIPAPVPGKAKGNKEPLKGILKKGTELPKRVARIEEEVSEQPKNRTAGEDFVSGDEELANGSDIKDDSDDNVNLGSDEELDEEAISRYDALLGGSSDEESFDEEIYKANRPAQPFKRLSLSLSPLPSPQPSDQDIESHSISPSPPPRKAPKLSKTKLSKEAPKKSTFLPTLMGGYYSGSESSASDIEGDGPEPVRKNRPGQMARRAIWEKKFGKRANHIKSGAEPMNQKKDDGWDAKRGAKDDSRRGGGDRGRGRGGLGDAGRTGRQRDFSKVTGENAMPVGDKKGRRLGKKDDVGVLHPSWLAAKKAKTEQKTATFAGKKVVFD